MTALVWLRLDLRLADNPALAAAVAAGAPVAPEPRAFYREQRIRALLGGEGSGRA